jgi:hypothetical protein
MLATMAPDVAADITFLFKLSIAVALAEGEAISNSMI